MEIEKVAIRITEEVRIKLEEYIVREGLHRKNVKYRELVSDIIKMWLKEPMLNKDKLIYGTSNEARSSRVTVNLTREENIKAYEIYVDKYIRECRTLNILLYNVLLQFIDKNFDDFDIEV